MDINEEKIKQYQKTVEHLQKQLEMFTEDGESYRKEKYEQELERMGISLKREKKNNDA